MKARNNGDGSPSAPTPIVLANWGRRLIAWFIDYLIINVMLAYVQLESFESRFIPPYLLPKLPGFDISAWSPISVAVFFLYWTFSEWYFGRSIGQLLLNLRLVDSAGNPPSLAASAVQSVGKSLLLPVDCVIGWAYGPTRKKRQRFFNKLSDTIVMFVGISERYVQEDEYLKEP